MLIVRSLIGVLVLAFLAGYVIPNAIRYPWHTIVFVAAALGISAMAGAGERVMSRLRASAHPAARRSLAMHAGFFALLHGVPPYDSGRWWLARTVVQALFWMVMLAAALVVLVAMGYVFHWIDAP
jgi:hypothetical protein